MLSHYRTGTVERGREDFRSFKRPEVSEAERAKMRSIDVLGFGIDAFPDRELGDRGIWVAGVTALKRSAIFLAGNSYLNRTAQRIAEEATPEQYDLVVVDNHVYSATRYLEFLSREMIGRTMVLHPGYDGSADEEILRDHYGVTHFARGYRGDTADAMIAMLEELPVVDRPDRPDIEIVTHWPGAGSEPGFEPASRQYDIG